MTNMRRKLTFLFNLLFFISGCASTGSFDTSLSPDELNKIMELSESESKHNDDISIANTSATLTLKKMSLPITDEQKFVIRTFIKSQQQSFSLAQINVPIDNKNYAVMGTMLANARLIRAQLNTNHISSEIMIDPAAVKGQFVLTFLEGGHHAK